MDKTIIAPMEQMRDFDYVQGAHDVLVSVAGLCSDITSGLPYTVVGGMVASQNTAPSLSIVVSPGRIYQFAPSDAVASGSIPQDLSVIVQQGYNAGQTLTLTPPASGQSQWNVVQAQFSQQDAVRTNDPNGGVVPFYNAANPTQPTLSSINTVRKGVCVLQVITGAAATTGSEIPPTPTNGWVPLYMVDLTGGQTQITTSQIIKCGPSVGTGVPSNYPAAPFLAGFLASHHSGTQGQAPKINLTSEVQGILPYANMSSVRTLLNAALTLYVNGSTGADTNAGTSPTAAFKTVQAAVNAVYRSYDFNGNACTVSVANGSYVISGAAGITALSLQGTPVGLNGSINLVGNTASPGSVTIGVTNGNGIIASLGAAVALNGFTITTTGTSVGLVTPSGYGVSALTGASVVVSNCVIGNCGSTQLWAATGGFLQVSGSLTLTGTTPASFSSGYSGTLWANGATVTVTGLTSTDFVSCSTGSTFEAVGMTFVGTVVGQKYAISTCGSIVTNGAGVNYFPGNTAGASGTGGQYV